MFFNIFKPNHFSKDIVVVKKTENENEMLVDYNRGDQSCTARGTFVLAGEYGLFVNLWYDAFLDQCFKKKGLVKEA